MIPRIIATANNKGDEAMPNPVKFESVDLSTFFDKCEPQYAWPGEVTLNERATIDRRDGGRWDREVRD